MLTASQAQDLRRNSQQIGHHSTIVNAGEKVCDAPFKSFAQLNRPQIMKAPQRADSLGLSGLELITKQPEGNVSEMVKTSTYFYINYYWLSYTDNGGSRCMLVEGTDGNWYLSEPLSGLTTGTWLKLEKEGDELVAKLPQAIYHEDASEQYEESTYYAFAMTFSLQETDEGTTIRTGFCDTQEFRFLLNGDSIVAKDPTMMLGLCDQEAHWVYYGDYNYCLKKFADQPVQVDADVAANAMTFSMKYNDPDYNTPYGCVVSGAFDDNGHVYVKGVFSSAPDAWVEGTFDGQKAVFPSGQYVAYNDGWNTYTYFTGAAGEKVYDEEYNYSYWEYTWAKEVTFDVDLTTMTMTTDDCVLLNTSKRRYINYIEAINLPEISLWSESAGTPEDPQFWSFSDYFETDGWSSIATYLPVFDTTGKLMNQDKMTYSYYVDDEVLELSPEDGYVDANGNSIEAISVLPYDYTAYGAYGYDCYNSLGLHYLYIYFTGFDKIGVQTTYNGGGETHSSNIVYYGESSGVNSVMADVTSVRYTDLSGRKVQKPAHGLYIKTVTMSDGTVKSEKVLRR